jgi:hypothetical protein
MKYSLKTGGLAPCSAAKEALCRQRVIIAKVTRDSRHHQGPNLEQCFE